MADELRPQRRGRRISMTDDERDAFLSDERTCRVATMGPDCPHATPLWFVWDGDHLWLYSIIRSQRWADIVREPRLGIVVDAGHDYDELRGVEITGTAETMGELPRTGTPDEHLAPVEAMFGGKYARGDGQDQMVHDGRHGWLRVTPTKITSWDFRKLASG